MFIKILSYVKNKISFYAGNIFYYKKSYAQEAEDLILATLLNNKKKGFYIDVGCYHPFRFSNTYLFYKQGWSGVNIDAMPGTKALFDKKRKNDLNLEVGVSLKEEETDFYIFKENCLNTFDPNRVKFLKENTSFAFDKIVKVKTKPLKLILEESILPNTSIDFLTIDAEDFDMIVIESNDWDTFRPHFILIEQREKEIDELKNSAIYKFLYNHDYRFICRTPRTCFYKDRNYTD
jgi:hypothetical protein